VTDLLLITDVPRLRKIFNRLSDDRGITLRTASNLEKGVEELIARKPAVIFVQTHLSGLSADILLMHLKKQLGRKRSRFILLSTPAQVSAETIKLYHGHIDTSLEETALLDAIRNSIAPPAKKNQSDPKSNLGVQDVFTASPVQHETLAVINEAATPQQQDIPAIAAPPVIFDEQHLENQGIIYSPHSRLKVYSEFASSFDNAVESMPEPEQQQKAPRRSLSEWDLEHLESIESDKKRPNRFSLLFWIAPVLVAALVVTLFQNRKSSQTTDGNITPPPPQQVQPLVRQNAPLPTPVTSSTKPATSPLPPAVPPVSAKDITIPLTDKSALSGMAGGQGGKETTVSPHASPRPVKLPDFIPTYGKDRKFSAANQGWERYQGEVTEFKVYREKESIKAIQVIDHGGQGVPESFMKGVLRRMVKNPSFILESSEKKDGYEILRGHIADNLKVIYYRDEHGGRLRAFVMTWQ